MTGRRPFASLFACFDNAEAPCGRIDSARWCRAQTPCSPSSSAGASQTSSRRCGASVRSHPSSRVACRVAAATVLLVDRNLNPQEKLIRKVANEMLFSWFQSGSEGNKKKEGKSGDLAQLCCLCCSLCTPLARSSASDRSFPWTRDGSFPWTPYLATWLNCAGYWLA